MNDETILASLAGKDPEVIFRESVLRRLGMIEDKLGLIEERLDVIEEYQEPIRELIDQVKHRLIQALALLVVSALLGGTFFTMAE